LNQFAFFVEIDHISVYIVNNVTFFGVLLMASSRIKLFSAAAVLLTAGTVLLAGLGPTTGDSNYLGVHKPVLNPELFGPAEMLAERDVLRNAEAVLAELERLELADQPVIETQSPWALASAGDSLDPSIPLNSQIREYEAVKQSESFFPAPGDKVQMPLPDGDTVSVLVAEQRVSSNGDLSWSGYLEGHADDYPVVVTVGSNSSFATITSPNGSYSMESVNGTGWVYKNPSVPELAEPDARDYLVPQVATRSSV